MNWSAEKRIFAGFGVALVILVTMGVLSHQITVNLLETGALVDHTEEFIGNLNRTFSLMQDVETSARGFVITGNEAFLEPRKAAVDQIRIALDGLHQLTTDMPDQRARFNELARLVEDKLEITDEHVRLRREEGLMAAAERIADEEGRLVMDKIRSEIGGMIDAARASLVDRQERARSAADTTQAVVAGGHLLAVAIVALCALILRQVYAKRRHAEIALRESEQRLQSVMDNAPAAIFVKDVEGRYVLVNRRLESIFGIPRDRFLNRTDFELLPKDLAATFRTNDQKVITTGKPIEFEESLAGDAEGRVFISVKFPLHDVKGEIYAVCGIATDITERKRAEAAIQALAHELERRVAELKEVNQELESFSYSVSHDLRAPLRHIDGFVSLLQKHLGEGIDATGRRYLSIISEAARRMGKLIDDLLAFSRMGRAELSAGRVNLNQLVESVWHDLDPEMHGRAVLRTTHPLPDVEGDSALLRQVFMNLLSNAIKFTRPRDPAEIEIGARNGEPPDEVVIHVRDNGVGFDMKYADKLFGVFQRLHRSDEFDGTGIGLANVRRIILRHGGRLWAESELDRGTTFYFTLKKPSA